MTDHQPPQAGDVPLAGGRMTSGIVRRGDQLLRPMGPWSPAVHEYLRHLEAAGFEGSPRVLGTEGDREVLTFIDGDVAMDPLWQPGHGNRLPPYARTEVALRAARPARRSRIRPAPRPPGPATHIPGRLWAALPDGHPPSAAAEHAQRARTPALAPPRLAGPRPRTLSPSSPALTPSS